MKKNQNVRWFKSFDQQVDEELSYLLAANPNGVEAVLKRVAASRVEKRLKGNLKNKGRFENQEMKYGLVVWMVKQGIAEV